MLPLDALAHTGRWRGRHPGEKAFLAFGLLGCAVLLPPWPGAALAGAAAVAVAVGPAGVAPRQLWRAGRVPLGFITVGALPLLVAVGGAPPVRFDPAGAPAAAALVGRSAAAVCCLLLFAATTPLADVLPRLTRLGVPPAVTEVAALVHRMLFLLLENLNTVREAQAGRLGFRTWATAYRSLAGQGGAVFVGAFDRARRLEEGLALRGYAGDLRVQVPEQRLSRPFLGASAVLLGAVVTTAVVLG